MRSEWKIGVFKLGDLGRKLFELPAHGKREDGLPMRLPLGREEAGPVVGAEPPACGAHGLRVPGVARQIAEPVKHPGRIAPCFAGLVAVMLVQWIELTTEAVCRKGESIRCKIFGAGVVVSPPLVTQPRGCILTVADFPSRFQQQTSPNPMKFFPRHREVFVRIGSRSEP